MKKKLFIFIISNRILISLIFLGLTVCFGWFAVQVQFDNTIETYFLKDDLKDYELFLDQFGTDELVVIAFECENAFTPENLRLIDRISQKLEDLPHIRRVISLTTTQIVYSDGDTVFFDPLIDKIPDSDAEMEVIRKRAMADAFIPGTLISHDAKHTAIVSEIDHLIGEFDYKIELLDRIRDFLKIETKKTGHRFYIGGAPVLDDGLFRYTRRDQIYFFPLMMAVIIFIIFCMFRRVKLTLLPLLVVALSGIWTYGFLVILGYKINIITTILGPLLMSVAIADSIHFTADYLQECGKGNLTKIEHIGNSFENLISPCAMTSLTTVLGLLSLLSANLQPVRQFGLVAAGGVSFAFTITIFLLPILFSIMPLPDKKYSEAVKGGFFANILHRLGRWKRWRSQLIFLIVLLVALPAGWGLRNLKVGTNSLDYFKQNDTVRAQTEWIDATIGGTTSLEFYIDAGEGNTLKDPALLRKIADFMKYLKGLEGITDVFSAVDLVKSLNKAFHEGDKSRFAIPESSLEIGQQMLIVEGSREMEALLSSDYSLGRITARVKNNDSQKLSHQMPKIKEHLQAVFGISAKVIPTGMIYLINQMERYLLSSQIKSFLLAFLVVNITMVFLLRSFKLGILAMIPNILPIFFTWSLMPMLDIPLDVGTVMIASVALGLVVDDTIHFLLTLKEITGRGKEMKWAIPDAMNRVGRPIIFTSIILSFGFLVLVFASFNPVIHFGILASTVVMLALIFDLAVLPAILGFVRGT